MIFGSVLGFALSAAASLLATSLVLRWAQRAGWLESPSSRGLHLAPTLSRGGVGFVLVSAVALFFVLSMSGFAYWQSALLLGGGLGIAVMGFIDDAHPLPILPRLGVQFLMAATATWVLHPAGELNGLFLPASLTTAVVLVAWVWMINLFNFMDGIDGLVATGVTTISLAAAVLSVSNDNLMQALAWAVLAGATGAFLRWNWPPARIFMGDVGSGYLGYVVALLTLMSVQQSAVSLWAMLILLAPFLVDTGFTLLRRMGRGDRWYQAHRQHAYQKLALRWASHLPVTRGFLGLQVLVMAPLAAAAEWQPQYGPLLALSASLGLGWIAWRVNAGTPEPAADGR